MLEGAEARGVPCEIERPREGQRAHQVVGVQLEAGDNALGEIAGGGVVGRAVLHAERHAHY